MQNLNVIIYESRWPNTKPKSHRKWIYHSIMCHFWSSFDFFDLIAKFKLNGSRNVALVNFTIDPISSEIKTKDNDLLKKNYKQYYFQVVQSWRIINQIWNAIWIWIADGASVCHISVCPSVSLSDWNYTNCMSLFGFFDYIHWLTFNISHNDGTKPQLYYWAVSNKDMIIAAPRSGSSCF